MLGVCSSAWSHVHEACGNQARKDTNLEKEGEEQNEKMKEDLRLNMSFECGWRG